MTDRQQFETVFRRYYDSMYRLARHFLHDDAESKDVVSDIFTQLLDSRRDLHDDTLRAYLLTSVRNRCINVVRRRHTAAELPQSAADDDARDGEELLAQIHRYVDRRLPPLAQEVLRLRYQQGLKYREIAAVLGVSEVTVHHHLSQSLRTLKQHFKSLGYGIE